WFVGGVEITEEGKLESGADQRRQDRVRRRWSRKTGGHQPFHRKASGFRVRQFLRRPADAGMDRGGNRRPVHGLGASYRRRTRVGLRSQVLRRPLGQGVGRSGETRLDSDKHENGMEKDLPVRTMKPASTSLRRSGHAWKKNSEEMFPVKAQRTPNS